MMLNGIASGKNTTVHEFIWNNEEWKLFVKSLD